MSDQRTVRVRFAVTLDVDLNDWEEAYGVVGAQAVRRDVKGYLLQLFAEGVSEGGLSMMRLSDG